MTRRQPPAARRQAILDAAAWLLVSRGLAGTSVDAVAQRAGIAKGTVYLYFASRSDLLGALRNRYAHGLADQAQSSLEHADPADPVSVTAAVDRLAAELLGYVHANRRLYHILFHQTGGHEQAAEPLLDLLTRLLSQAIGQGALTPADPGLLARFLLDGLHGALLPLAHHDQPGRPQVPASLHNILRRLLAPVISTTGENPDPPG
jgi:TetR/AcrR family transcriptional regulator, transcriptional repressor for nem operon